MLGDQWCVLSSPLPLRERTQVGAERKPWPPPSTWSGSSRDWQQKHTDSRLPGLTLTQDAEGGSKGLHAGQPAGPAIVHRIGGHQMGQEPQVAPTHLPERSLIQPGPGAVDDSDPRLCHQVSAKSSEGLGSGLNLVLAPGQLCSRKLAALGIQGYHSRTLMGPASEAVGRKLFLHKAFIHSTNVYCSLLLPGLCARQRGSTRHINTNRWALKGKMCQGWGIIKKSPGRPTPFPRTQSSRAYLSAGDTYWEPTGLSTRPPNLWPRRRQRTSPRRASLRPVQRRGSQWPNSHMASVQGSCAGPGPPWSSGASGSTDAAAGREGDPASGAAPRPDPRPTSGSRPTHRAARRPPPRRRPPGSGPQGAERGLPPRPARARPFGGPWREAGPAVRTASPLLPQPSCARHHFRFRRPRDHPRRRAPLQVPGPRDRAAAMAARLAGLAVLLGLGARGECPARRLRPGAPILVSAPPPRAACPSARLLIARSPQGPRPQAPPR